MGEGANLFGGDKKTGKSMLHDAEGRLRDALLPMVPRGVETYHLTMLTVLWSILVVLFSWFASFDVRWMWAVSGMIVAQYITDLLDGAIGRQRDTGLIKWGFYMDHFLDYLFLCSMMIGYSFLLPPGGKLLMFFVMAILCAYMVNSFLQFAATNEFQIAYMGIGPTEVRIGLILLNTLVIFVDRRLILQSVPIVLWIATIGLVFTAYRTQRILWQIDMDAQDAADKPRPEGTAEGLFVRRIITSFALASVAFVVLLTRLFEPMHKMVAGGIYILSWLPLVLAFKALRSGGHPAGRWQNPLMGVRLVMGVAVALLVVGLGAAKLAPLTFDREGSTAEMRRDVDVDIERVAALREDIVTHGAALKADVAAVGEGEAEKKEMAALKVSALEWAKDVEALRRLSVKYRGFAQIDVTEAPGVHADAFLVAYTSFVGRYHALVDLHATMGDMPGVISELDDAMTRAEGRKAEFKDATRSLLSPVQLLRLASGSAYLRMLSRDWDRSGDTTEAVLELRKALEAGVREQAEMLYDRAVLNPGDIML